MKCALLLEDIPESQDMLRNIAQAAFPEISIHSAGDIAGAMALLNEFKFDLALIDLSLPDGNGTEVVQALSARFPECIIVIASIFEDDEHLFPALRAGAQGYLLKEQAPERLIMQLRGISEGHPPLSPSVARRLLDHFRAVPEEEAKESLLTPREREVLGMLARGISATKIANQLGISRHTVGEHAKNIYRKLNITSRAEAALQAKNLGLV